MQNYGTVYVLWTLIHDSGGSLRGMSCAKGKQAFFSCSRAFLISASAAAPPAIAAGVSALVAVVMYFIAVADICEELLGRCSDTV